MAAAAYRGVLLALPASAALWFGDLRDRGLAAAVEAYTRTHVSPALLSHQLAVLHVRYTHTASIIISTSTLLYAPKVY